MQYSLKQSPKRMIAQDNSLRRQPNVFRRVKRCVGTGKPPEGGATGAGTGAEAGADALRWEVCQSWAEGPEAETVHCMSLGTRDANSDNLRTVYGCVSGLPIPRKNYSLLDSILL